MEDLRLPLKKKWFEMTKEGIKTEDYREITPYWCKMLLWLFLPMEEHEIESLCEELKNGINISKLRDEYMFEEGYFPKTILTLGYPKNGDKERIITYKNLGIEVREGNPEWGAEKGKIYFVIKHGERVVND